MNIVTVGDLKKALKNVPDDFKLSTSVMVRLPDEDLKGMIYPYPFNIIQTNLTIDDVGFSDKVLKCSCHIDKSDVFGS